MCNIEVSIYLFIPMGAFQWTLDFDTTLDVKGNSITLTNIFFNDQPLNAKTTFVMKIRWEDSLHYNKIWEDLKVCKAKVLKLEHLVCVCVCV